MGRVLAVARIRAILLAFVILPTAAPLPAWAEMPDAGETDALTSASRAPVVSFEQMLLSIMKNANALGFEGRRKGLAPVVESTFDLEFMAGMCLGRSRKNYSPDLRARWVESFTRYLTTKLANQFNRFSGQRFVVEGERSVSKDTRIVMSKIERPEKDPIQLDFRVRRGATGEWLIVDIYAKGRVSEVAMRRSEYTKILESRGIEGLIESVDALSDRTAEKADAYHDPGISRPRHT